MGCDHIVDHRIVYAEASVFTGGAVGWLWLRVGQVQGLGGRKEAEPKFG